MTVNYDSLNQNDIRARELMQAWFNERGINPVIRLHDRGQGDASLDVIAGFATYADVARVLGCESEDESGINDAIYDQYEHFCEVAAEQIKRDTLEAITISEREPSQTPAGASGMAYQQGEQILTWEGRDGFYGCFAGMGEGGNYSESEDQGPFESRQDAVEALEGSIEDEDEQWDEVY